jgi:hypothetical protein
MKLKLPESVVPVKLAIASLRLRVKFPMLLRQFRCAELSAITPLNPDDFFNGVESREFLQAAHLPCLLLAQGYQVADSDLSGVASPAVWIIQITRFHS